MLEAEKLLRCMMQAAPAAVLRRLQEAQCQVAIIGRQQVTTDIPAHHFMKHCKGRDIDGTTRGLGGTAAIPVTSCGEENLTMVDDRWGAWTLGPGSDLACVVDMPWRGCYVLGHAYCPEAVHGAAAGLA